MDGLEKFIKSKKVPYIRIDGKVNVDERHRRVTSFQNDDNIRVALLSIMAAS